MWYRNVSMVVVCAFAATSSAWAQPPGRGGRGNSDDALRKLEQEVAQLRAEVKKLQTAQTQPRQNWGGPQAFAGRPGGFGGFGGGPWQQMAFRGPGFGPRPGAQWQTARGFRGEQFGGKGHKHRHHKKGKHGHKRGAKHGAAAAPQHWQAPQGAGFRGPGRGESFQGRPGGPGGPPPRSRSGDERPRSERRPVPPA